jgi:hypothetical protein
MGEEIPQFRQFVPPLRSMKNGSPRYAEYGECYMTPEEARFLVESHENRAYTEAGEVTPYSYPAGVPLPVADNFEGPLLAPLTSKTLGVADSRQMEAAERMMAERDASLGGQEKASVPAETPAERKTRKRAQRSEARSETIDADDSAPTAPGLVPFGEITGEE